MMIQFQARSEPRIREGVYGVDHFVEQDGSPEARLGEPSGPLEGRFAECSELGEDRAVALGESGENCPVESDSSYLTPGHAELSENRTGERMWSSMTAGRSSHWHRRCGHAGPPGPEQQLLGRARYLKSLGEAAGKPSLRALAEQLEAAHSETVQWISTVLAQEALGGPAASRATALQRAAGGVSKMVGLPPRVAREGGACPSHRDRRTDTQLSRDVCCSRMRRLGRRDRSAAGGRGRPETGQVGSNRGGYPAR